MGTFLLVFTALILSPLLGADAHTTGMMVRREKKRKTAKRTLSCKHLSSSAMSSRAVFLLLSVARWGQVVF
jgi:hypothetical protein